MQDQDIECAHGIGFDDGYDGEYTNPYDKRSETGQWLAYRAGFDRGLELFTAEESTPDDP